MREQISDLWPVSAVLGAQLPFLRNESPQLMKAELFISLTAAALSYAEL